jgi:EmrB/QacA subfamily drug resistance transporter
VTASTDEDTARTLSGRRRWLALVVLSVGQLMVALDATVVNVALPTIQRELHFSQASLAWVVNAYLITFGGLLLLAGRLGDLVGRKRLFLIGLGAFCASSMLCGVASSAAMLVASRFLQGASAAMMSSMVLGTLSPMFPEPKERTRALSVFAAVTLGGASLGLPIGGGLIELSWHWIFFINVPFGLTALVMSARLLEPHVGLGIREGADVLGALLVTSAPMLVVYALIETSGDGWGSVETIGLFAGSAALVGLFVFVESHVRTPLIPLRIFRHHNLVSANIVRFLYPIGAFGLNFIGSQYLQFVVGYNPLRSGLAFIPNSLLIGVISLLGVPVLLGRVGPKPLILTGLTLIIGGLLVFSRAPVHAHYVTDVLPALLLIGTGFALVFTPTVGVALSDVAPDEAGLVSGLTNVSVQMGGSIGVALLASVSASRTTRLLAEHVSRTAARAAGYHFGFRVAAVCSAVALAVAVVALRPRSAAGVELTDRSDALPVLE